MSELSARLVRAANDALGNDTKHVLDCSTGQVVAAVFRELADAISEHFDALNDAGYPEDFELPTATDFRFMALEAEKE